MKNWKIWMLAVMLAVACKKPYNPGVINSPQSYLIVEGTIVTNDVTTVKLSKTVNLSSTTTTNPVTGAVLTVEADNNSSYALTEQAPGTYTLTGAGLDIARKYRLRIKTVDNKEYLSDFEQAKATPPIDSIGYKILSNGISIYANSHDPNNNTHYYRFDYTETWKFHSKYQSNYMSNGDSIVSRPQDQMIYYCFANNTSSTILLGSTAKLTQDVLYQTPITQIAGNSEKIEIKYSILLHEYALSADAYKFWGNLKKNTEQLGSIFDAEPSQISGNIHNIKDPTEVVVGYISSGTVQTKRVFISNQDLPTTFLTDYPYDCGIDSDWYDHPKTHINDVAVVLIPKQEIPISAFSVGFAIAGYTASTPACIDCTLRGSTQQPDFWKN
ncbi:MAG: DUF4249 domain-containing protein [Bacteroidota bacterium]|nr:DUF4249 domain-containing protein [Bacteroidota bacterium]